MWWIIALMCLVSTVSAQTLEERVQEQKQRLAIEAAEQRAEEARFWAHVREKKARAQKLWLRYARPATAADYAAWLRGYLQQGGQITSTYDYPMPIERIVIAKLPCHITPLHGASAYTIIVPQHVPCTMDNDIGHNRVLYMHDFSRHNMTYVELYSDVEALLYAE